MFVRGNSLLRRNTQFVFEKFYSREQSWRSFLFAQIIKFAQSFVSFTLAAFAIRKLVGSEPLVIARRARQGRGFGIKLRRACVIVIFLLIKPGQRFVKLRFVRIIGDPALQEIFGEREVFALRLYPLS